MIPYDEGVSLNLHSESMNKKILKFKYL